MKRAGITTIVVVLFVLQGFAQAQTLNLLVTNDDGVGAPGIDALVQELVLNPNLNVTVIAPLTNQSGTTDTFTTGPGSIVVTAATTASTYPAMAVAGTPVDSVLYGLLVAMVGTPPDLVLSGINSGQNITRFIAEDLSGTVGAALTAGRRGIPAIAVSNGIGSSDFAPAAKYVANVVENFRVSKRLARKMQSKTGLDQRIVLNVNFPNCGAGGAIRGVEVVPLASSQDFLGRSVAGYTQGPPGEWTPTLSVANAFASDCTSVLEDPLTDLEAMNNGFASVTPLNPTITPDSKVKRFRFLARIPFN